MSTLDADSLPRGADDCLSGETFVITGTLPHLSRCVNLQFLVASSQLLSQARIAGRMPMRSSSATAGE